MKNFYSGLEVKTPFSRSNSKLLFLGLLFGLPFFGISQSANFELTKTVTNTSPNAGEPFSYIINAACNSNVRDCETAVITDCLDPSLIYLGYSNPLPSGVVFQGYNSGTHCVTFGFDATLCQPGCTPDGINTDNDDFAQGSTVQIEILVMFPNGTITGTTAQNTVNGTSVNAGNPSDSAPTVTVSGTGGQTGCDAIPSFAHVSGSPIPGGEAQVRVGAQNLGTANVSNYEITADVPSNIDFTYIRGIDHEFGYCTDYDVYYEDANSGSYTFWATINSCNDDRLYEYNLPAGTDVTSLKFDFGTLTGNGAWNPNTWLDSYSNTIKIYGTLDPNANPGDIISFCSTTTGTVSGTNCTDTGCATRTVSAGQDVVSGGKEILDPNTGVQATTFGVGDIYTVALTYANIENMTEDLIGGYMIDVLPHCMEYVPNSWSFSWGFSTADNENPQVNVGNMPDGRQYVEFIWDDALGNEFVIESSGGWEGFQIEFDVQITSACAAGWYTNEFYYGTTGNPATTNCAGSSPVHNLSDFGSASTYVTNGELCFETKDLEVVSLGGGAGLESYKYVKGTRDTDYHRFPTTGETVPGGLNDYKICLSNPNATPVNDIEIIDIFPTPGDTEILESGTPRGSQWTPILASSISVPAGITVYYSTATNPCRDELADPGDPTPFPTGCSPANWSTAPPLDLSTVTAVKFDFGSITMNQGDEICIEWDMRAPIGVPTNCDVAWNSFAYSAANASNGTDLLSAEPIKVGIELCEGQVPIKGDFVWHDVNKNGIQDPGESGIDGVIVNLYEDSNNNGIAEPGVDQLYAYTISQAGGQYIFSDFPTGNYFLEYTNFPAGYNPTIPYATPNAALDSQKPITGVFTVTSTTDDRDCDFGLIQGAPLPLNCAITFDYEIGCGDGPIGIAHVDPIGGAGSYTYQWNDPANSTTAQVSGLYAGNTYSVTVYDGANNNSTCSVTLPTLPVFNVDIPDDAGYCVGDEIVVDIEHESECEDDCRSISYFNGTDPAISAVNNSNPKVKVEDVELTIQQSFVGLLLGMRM